MQWLNNLIERWSNWLESWRPCYKESLGYNCRHRTYADGTKECGTHPENYWQGNNE